MEIINIMIITLAISAWIQCRTTSSFSEENFFAQQLSRMNHPWNLSGTMSCSSKLDEKEVLLMLAIQAVT